MSPGLAIGLIVVVGPLVVVAFDELTDICGRRRYARRPPPRMITLSPRRKRKA